MVKYILGGLAVFVLVAAAFYGGLFIGRAKPDPPFGLPRPPAGDHWTYPGSQESSRVGGGEKYLAIQLSSDDFDTVAKFYHDRICATLGIGMTFDPKMNAVSSTGSGWGSYYHASDSFSSEKGGGPRKVRVWVFEVRSQVYDLTVFVNRAEGEGLTHVIITYDPKPPPS